MASRNNTPTSVSYYLGSTPSVMMTPGPMPRRGSTSGSQDQLRRIVSPGLTHTASHSIFKNYPPSFDATEKTEATIHAHRRHVVSPLAKKLYSDTSMGALMTQRKNGSVSRERIEGQEESAERMQMAEALKQKTMENDALRTEIFRLESELRNCKRNLKTAVEQNEDNFNTAELSDKQVKDILHSLNELIAKSEEAYASIEKKCERLEELILYIQSGVLSTYQGLELRSLTDKLQHIVEEFKPSSQLEIEVGKKTRELVKKKLDFAYLNTRYQKMTSRCEGLQHDLNILRQTLKAGHTEKNIFVRNLTKEKTLNRETQKKLGNLQKTLEILTEGHQGKLAQSEVDTSNLGIFTKETPQKGSEAQLGVGEEKELNTTKLREALSKLVKENEALRRVIHVRDKEIEKLSDNLSKTVWKLNKATLRIDKLRNHKTGHKMNDGTQDEEDLLVFYSSKKAVDMMNPAWDSLEAYRGLPKNLDFRFGLFEERYVDLINDVLEGGSQAFAEHVRMLTSDEELKEEVTLISNQFVSYRNFAEKMNRLMLECFSLFSLKTFNEVMVHVSTHMKPIMGAGTVRVWIHEPMTGTYRTMETPDKELKCVVNKGVIAEVIKTSRRILKRSQDHKYEIMETLNHNGTSGTAKARTCLLVPLKGHDGNIIGVLEVSKFSYETFLLDLDYFAQMLAELCVVLWNRTSRERILLNDLKMKEMYFDAFSDLAISLSQKEFSEKVEDWVSKIFQSSCTRYVIVDNSELLRFSKDSSPRILNGSTGIIGRVATTRKPFIVLEASGNAVHSENVDINTTFPLYTTPVIMKHRWNDPSTEDKNMIIGVLQIVMNQKSVIRENGTDEALTNHVKMIDPSTENLISKFTKLMAIAYDVMAKRTNKEEPVSQQPQKKKFL